MNIKLILSFVVVFVVLLIVKFLFISKCIMLYLYNYFILSLRVCIDN